MTNLWPVQITVQIGVFVAVNVFWKTAYNQKKKSAKTAAACLLRLDHPQLRRAMGGDFTALRNVTQRVRVRLKKNHALFAENFFTQEVISMI